ncbi:MAG: DnaJ domain-containing protein [Candidatus Sericytochromatia bacterium]|nr:DnaJ domain-containing protein [Candidatus Sericytochromatia bacterium]
MPEPPDHYARLGVSPQATEREIKAAYRALAKRLHPDLGGDAAALAAVNVAADVLLDATRRAAYDADRRVSPGPSSGPGDAAGARAGAARRQPTRKASVALCEQCGALNRVKGDPREVPASCGQCGHALGTPARTEDGAAAAHEAPHAEATHARCPHCQQRNWITAPPGAAQRCLGCGETFRPAATAGDEGVRDLLGSLRNALLGTESRQASVRGLTYLEDQLRALADEVRRRRESLERG